jgi:transposase InsO family protein
MSHTPDAQLAIDALKTAVAASQRRCMDQVVFYCDRGTPYTSQAFHAACARLGVAQSMSPTGSCVANAVAERLLATLKGELVTRVRDQPADRLTRRSSPGSTATTPAGCTPAWAPCPCPNTKPTMA